MVFLLQLSKERQAIAERVMAEGLRSGPGFPSGSSPKREATCLKVMEGSSISQINNLFRNYSLQVMGFYGYRAVGWVLKQLFEGIF